LKPIVTQQLKNKK